MSLSHGGLDGRYDDIEQHTGSRIFQVPASALDGAAGANLPGGATVEAHPIIDFDELVDRNEELRLLRVQHALMVYSPSTQTADGFVRGTAEFSTASVRQGIDAVRGGTGTPEGDVTGTLELTNPVLDDDSIDLIGRGLMASTGAQFSDGATGVGGGAGQGLDAYKIEGFPHEIGRFHPRDELFLHLSLEASNVDDASIQANVVWQYLFGVIED